MIRRTLLLIVLAALLVVNLPAQAHADVNDFEITSFHADETLTRHDRQGELRIVENIDVNFHDYNHGLLRAIPKSYKHHSLQLHVNSISSSSKAPTQFTTYTSNGNTVLKIGDANRTITGVQQYTIDYTLKNVISFYPDHDELYWDVNGDQWSQTFSAVSVQLHLPADIRQSREARCFAGSYGAAQQVCSVAEQEHGVTITATQPLYAHQTLTYVAGFEKGYFQPFTWKDRVAEYLKPALGVLLPVLLLAGPVAVYWWMRGRDPRGRGVIVPEYSAPAGMGPLEVGALMDFRADNKDITAALIGTAVRGYITIKASRRVKTLAKDTTEYSLVLRNPDITGLSANEQAILRALFPSMKLGNEVKIKDAKTKLYTVAKDAASNTRKQLVTDGYIADNFLKGFSLKKLGWMLLYVIIFVLSMIQGLGAGAVVGVILGILIAVLFLSKIDARTAKGVAAKEQIMGLKRYLQVAEKDRIAKLQSPNAPYAENAEAPVRTVELFEKLLPFAIILGVEQQWAGQFADMYKTPPDWYQGDFTNFNSYMLVNNLSTGMGAAVNTAFSPPSSSGSSGFSGGGFSGGGGGGGGGGGW